MAKIFILDCDPEEIEPPKGTNEFLTRKANNLSEWIAQSYYLMGKEAVLAHAKETDIDEKIRDFITENMVDAHRDGDGGLRICIKGDKLFSQFPESQTGERK